MTLVRGVVVDLEQAVDVEAAVVAAVDRGGLQLERGAAAAAAVEGRRPGWCRRRCAT